MESVRQAVVSILTQYLNDGSVDNIMIGVLASRAVDAFREYVNYPSSMHIESGLYRMWQKKGDVYTSHGVVPFATT